MRVVMVLAAVLLAGTGVAGVVDGPRWQLALPAAGAVLALLLALSRPERPAFGPRALRVMAWLLAGALVVSGAVLQVALPPLRLPATTGPYAVGTATTEWVDESRTEEATPEDPTDRRLVVAQVWHPADALALTNARTDESSRARYLGRTDAEAAAVAQGMADGYGIPAFALGDLGRRRTLSYTSAPVTPTGQLPVVLFSPGLLSTRFLATAWAQELASHGLVVVVLDHPYDSGIVLAEDGRVFRTRVHTTGDDEVDHRNALGWTRVRAADLRLAADRLLRLTPADPALGFLAGRLDASRITVAGHSLGGAAALLAAEQDDRFSAAVDIDGLARGLSGRGFTRPVLVVMAGRGTGSPEGDATYAATVDRAVGASRAGIRLTVPGAAHLSFTDAPLFLPPLPGLVGDGPRTRWPRTTASLTLTFLADVHAGATPDVVGQHLAAYGQVR